MRSNLLIFCLFICSIFSSYIPELMLTTTSDFFNKQLIVNGGPLINKLLNNYTIKDIHYNDTVDYVHVVMDLTNITQDVKFNWNSSVLNVTSERNFSLNAKNINVTIKAQIQYVIDRVIKNKGQLQIQIIQIQADTYHSFVRSSCPKSIGFSLFVNSIIADSSKFIINIKGKNLINKIISIIQNLVKAKVPNLINTKVRDIINQLIENTTCNGRVQQVLPIGHQSYVLSINTTDVPYFAKNKILTIPIDINFQNQFTNQTNEEVDNQNLIEQHVYEGVTNVTLSLSSNMLDTLLWLIDDSNILSVALTKDQLGPNPPISLDTSGLSILLPGLKKYPGKDVILRINTSSQFSSVFIRSGRFLSGISISVDFIINNTGKIQDLNTCLSRGDCFIVTQLNITLGLSASMRARKINTWQGLIQAIYVDEIKVINSLIEVNPQNLKMIINPLISSSRPQINKLLQQGIVFNPASIQKIKKLNVTGMIGQKFLDYASFGVLFEL